MSVDYPWTMAQYEKVAGRPRISGDFAVDKNLWEGREVAVLFLNKRGSLKRRTDMRFTYGTLVLCPNEGRTDQIGVRQRDGSVNVIHASRAKDIYDMTRKKAQ